jgi:solute carrier family 25 citrate transporter 1
MMDTRQMARCKYTNVVQTAMVLVREEGFGALYKGVVPTMLRQDCNQAANFTTYEYTKKSWQDNLGVNELASWQHLILGGISGEQPTSWVEEPTVQNRYTRIANVPWPDTITYNAVINLQIE